MKIRPLKLSALRWKSWMFACCIRTTISNILTLVAGRLRAFWRSLTTEVYIANTKADYRANFTFTWLANGCFVQKWGSVQTAYRPLIRHSNHWSVFIMLNYLRQRVAKTHNIVSTLQTKSISKQIRFNSAGTWPCNSFTALRNTITLSNRKDFMKCPCIGHDI